MHRKTLTPEAFLHVEPAPHQKTFTFLLHREPPPEDFLHQEPFTPEIFYIPQKPFYTREAFLHREAFTLDKFCSRRPFKNVLHQKPFTEETLSHQNKLPELFTPNKLTPEQAGRHTTKCCNYTKKYHKRVCRKFWLNMKQCYNQLLSHAAVRSARKVVLKDTKR